MKKLAFGLLALPVLVFLACEESGTPPTDYGPVLQAVSEAATADVNAFASRADDLVTTLKALEAAPDSAALAKAQASWRGVRAAYRKLDAMRIGPVVELGISERIDVATKPSDVDAIVSGGEPIDLALVAAAPGSRKGVLGVEYLLFDEKGADAALAALTGDGAPARKRTLARAMSEEFAQSAHQLQDAWNAGAKPIGGELAGAGKTSARYPTQRAAVDDLVASVGNGIEQGVVARLGRTLGKQDGTPPNPALEPARASDSAVADMTATLGGVAAVYENSGLGTRVKDKSAALDARVTSQIDDCSKRVAAIPAPYVASLTASTAAVEAAYESCKTLRTTWNTDLSSVVGATLKSSDNDGD